MAGQNKDTKEAGREAARETAAAKDVASGKEGKEAKENRDGKDGKERKGKDETARRLTDLAADLADLRRIVSTLVEGTKGQEAAPPRRAPDNPADLALTEADDALIARVGYALSSGPKVALARLLYTEGEQSASQLGEKAGLTTGSLYHHLRELMHAELVVQQTRTRYQLTPRGKRALAALTPLARE